MVSFNRLSAAIGLSAAVVSAIPTSSNALVARQATLPSECTDYCSVAAGCVCIRRPTNCVATYLVQSDENCGTLVEHFNNFTATDLLAWNPEIGNTCFGLRAFVPICIGVPGYTYPGPVKGGDIYTPAQNPVPVMGGIVANCTKFEFSDAKGLPTKGQILTEHGITQTQWNSWNFPTQDPNQDWGNWAGYFSCVQA